MLLNDLTFLLQIIKRKELASLNSKNDKIDHPRDHFHLSSVHDYHFF